MVHSTETKIISIAMNKNALLFVLQKGYFMWIYFFFQEFITFYLCVHLLIASLLFFAMSNQLFLKHFVDKLWTKEDSIFDVERIIRFFLSSFFFSLKQWILVPIFRLSTQRFFSEFLSTFLFNKRSRLFSFFFFLFKEKEIIFASSVSFHNAPTNFMFSIFGENVSAFVLNSFFFFLSRGTLKQF